MKPRKARKQVGDYILEKAIGFGAFSTVYEGHNVTQEEKVAVKSINLHRINVSEKHLSNLKQEIDILRQCRHRNIVQLLHTYQTSNHIYLIMQYCAGGDLHRFVQRNGKMSENAAQQFSIQLARGLKYLHSLKIIHRDLKPQNILLSHNSINAIVRIADFGFARYKPAGANMVDTMCGSPLYMAPEILKFNKYDSKVDLWSAGTIIYHMVTKEPPFNGANHIELLKKIESTKRLRFPVGLSDNCKELIIGLLKRNPVQRISWDLFFNHKWLQIEVKASNETPKNMNNNKKKTDPFIMINNAKNSGNLNSKKYAEFVNECVSKYEDLMIKYKYAKCIMKVGDVQTSQEQISCALLLYLRGLDLLQNIIVMIQKWIQTYAECHRYYIMKMKVKQKHLKYKESQDKLDKFSVKYKQLLLDSIGCYDGHQKRGEAIQTLCATQCLQFDLNRVNIDQVIFDFAIQNAKKMCADILLNMNEEEEEKENEDNDRGSINKIKQSQLLLQYLITLKSIEKQDKNEIDKYLVAIGETLNAIENISKSL